MSGLLISLSTTELTVEEKEFLLHPSVAGVILFSQNFNSVDQLQALISSIYRLKPQSLVAVDQEGGRVQRFHEGFTDMPSMSAWGDRTADADHLQAQFAQLSQELRAVGIRCNLVPVLDLDDQHCDIISDRSIGQDPSIVESIARDMIHILHRHGLPSVGKHFPGHGPASADSHQELPVDSRSISEMAPDIAVYKALIPFLDAIMTAHVHYTAVDPMPATFSPYWIRQVLREEMRFQGVVMTDDLNMAGARLAFSSISDRVMAAVDAGCDLLILCHNHEELPVALETLESLHDQQSEHRVSQFLEACQTGVFRSRERGVR